MELTVLLTFEVAQSFTFGAASWFAIHMPSHGNGTA